jgi:hypothetical protein
MGGVSFPGVSAPVVRWLRTEGYTAFSSFTHRLTLPPIATEIDMALNAEKESEHED